MWFIHRHLQQQKQYTEEPEVESALPSVVLSRELAEKRECEEKKNRREQEQSTHLYLTQLKPYLKLIGFTVSKPRSFPRIQPQDFGDRVARFCSSRKTPEEFSDQYPTSYCDLIRHFEAMRIFYETHSHLLAFTSELRRSSYFLKRNLERLDWLAQALACRRYGPSEAKQEPLDLSILQLLSNVESMSYGELLRTLNTNKATLSRYLEKLVQDGSLERTEVGRNVLYKLKRVQTGQGE